MVLWHLTILALERTIQVIKTKATARSVLTPMRVHLVRVTPVREIQLVQVEIAEHAKAHNQVVHMKHQEAAVLVLHTTTVAAVADLVVVALSEVDPQVEEDPLAVVLVLLVEEVATDNTDKSIILNLINL
jgi:hypothetical protein